MATSSIQVNVGSGGTYVATHPISEDAITKQLSRTVINSSAGAEQTAIAGLVSDAAVITDANGTIHQYLRGIAKAFLANLVFLTGVASDSTTTALSVASIQRKTLLRAVGNAATSGDNTIVVAVGSKKIKVYSYALQGVGTVNAKFTDGAAGTQLSMLWHFTANILATVSGCEPPNYLFATTAGNALILNCSGTAGVGYEVSYWADDGS